MSEAVLCDLVLLSWNHLEETRPCIESLLASTRVPSRLIIVDNASEPEVRRYLAQVKPSGQIRQVSLIQSETNEGFPRGMNRGIAESRAPFVCLLNNDIRVTPGWLEAMLEVCRAEPSIGLVNPESNTFGNRPPRGESIESYAKRLEQHRGQYVETGMCIGFCMLIRRELLDRIGGLSEEVERGFYEDEDYSQRALLAGFRCAVASASYVEHAEHRSFKDVPEQQQIFERNRNWCNAKWGRRVRIAWPHFESIEPGSAALREWLSRLLVWARRRTYVYVYGAFPKGQAQALFRSVGLSPHADIHWYRIPKRLSRWAAAARVLKRRKKRFDIVVAPDPGWGRFMQGLRWLHGAEVVIENNEETLKAQWQRRSRCPSSS